jgi:hypothetical protein
MISNMIIGIIVAALIGGVVMCGAVIGIAWCVGKIMHHNSVVPSRDRRLSLVSPDEMWGKANDGNWLKFIPVSASVVDGATCCFLCHFCGSGSCFDGNHKNLTHCALSGRKSIMSCGYWVRASRFEVLQAGVARMIRV